MGEQLKEEEEKASSFHYDVSEMIRGGKCHMINQKSYASLRAAWVQGRGHQAEQLSLPGSTSRNAGRSLGGGCQAAQASKCSVASTVSIFFGC